MEPKYRALWIPSGKDLALGTICIDPFGQPYRYTQRNGKSVFEDDGVFYLAKDHQHKFKPAELYLCDRELTVGCKCFNPRTRECFDVLYETYVVGTNANEDDYRVVGAIDPNRILRGFTPIEEENIEGFMFGGGDDQLGYFALTGILDHFHVSLPTI